MKQTSERGHRPKFWLTLAMLVLMGGIILGASAPVSAEETQVNTYSNADQIYPSAAMNDSGNFVITWESLGQDGSGYGVHAQRYNSSSNPVGVEFQVNIYTTSDQRNPSVAMGDSGNFVIAWESDGQDGAGIGVFAQRYDNSGNPVGVEFQVNIYTTSIQRDPSAAMDATGNFVITWQSYGQDGDRWGVYARRYDASGNPVGTEFQVNTHTTDEQKLPSAAMAAAGNFVIAWGSDDQDGDSSGVYARRYDASGNPVGAEFLVNTHTTGYQNDPSVAINATGNFVITWYGKDASDSDGIYAQRYDASGNPVGEEFLVNTYTTMHQLYPSVAMDATGNFVVAWHGAGASDSSGIYAQRYDSSGNPLGAEFLVNTYTTYDQLRSSVVINDSGNLVITWMSYGYLGNSWEVFMDRFTLSPPTCTDTDGDGYSVEGGDCGEVDCDDTDPGINPGATEVCDDGKDNNCNGKTNEGCLSTETQVNTYITSNQRYPSVAMNAAGNSVIAWQSEGQDGSGYGIYAQRYNSIDNPLGSEFQVNTYITSSQRYPSVAMDIAGNFVIAWQSAGQDGSGDGINAQRYNSIGNPLGSEFQVNIYTQGRQWYPSVAMDDSGNFVIAWQSDGQDGDRWGVYAQRYDSSGNPVGAEFQVNTETWSHQRDPSTAMDAAGNFVIAWESAGQDGDRWGVYAQRYDSSGNPVGAEFQVNTYITSNQRYPSVAMDIAGNFVIAWESAGQYGSGDGINAQRYDNSGNPLGSEFRMNTYTPGDQSYPSVAMAAAGNFVIAWESLGQAGGGVYAQRYTKTGHLEGAEFHVNQGERPSAAMDAEGNFVIAWTSDGQDGDSDGVFMSVFTHLPPACTDTDGDGYSVEGGDCGEVDCDDSDASINPGATEVCDDSIDNNCDGQVDVDCDEADGDVNGDGNITPQDALMTFQQYLGLIQLDESQLAHCDVNQDGNITPADALCIFQKYLGLSSCLDG